jgi:ABC-2 type transport system ATP-binding protein
VFDVRDVTVTYPSFSLGPVTLSIEDGITAVLGPNGSGKTTLFKAITGLVPGATGRVSAFGADLMAREPEALRRTSYVPDGEAMLFSELTAQETWALCAHLRSRRYGEDEPLLLRRACAYAERLDLRSGGTRIGEFSLGMRRKTQLVLGLMTEPDLLLVDEPQNGLDFTSSQEVRSILIELQTAGRIVVMSNHDLDSVARIAQSVVVLRQGRIAARSEERFDSGGDCEAFVQRALS